MYLESVGYNLLVYNVYRNKHHLISHLISYSMGDSVGNNAVQ